MAIISLIFLFLYLDLRKLYPKIFVWFYQSSLLLTMLMAYLLMAKQQAAADEIGSVLFAFILTLVLEYVLIFIEKK